MDCPLEKTYFAVSLIVSFRLSPAQRAALMSVLEGKLWMPEILSTILIHNPTLLAAVSNKVRLVSRSSYIHIFLSKLTDVLVHLAL